MTRTPTTHQARADVLAFSMTGAAMTTYPRIRVRVNAAGKYDAYLIKASFSHEVYVSTGPTIAGALWWVRPSAPRCCLAGA